MKLLNADGGETLDDERMVKAMNEKCLGDLFCMSGDATYGCDKEILDYDMKNGGGYIDEKELKRAIKLMKENNATYKIAMIAEYIEALGDHYH